MALLWFNLGMIAILILRRRNAFIQTYGIQLLFLLILGCFFRVVISIEFPFVKVIGSKKIYPWILKKLNNDLIFTTFSLLELLTFFSLLGSSFLFIFQTLKYWRFRKNLEYSSVSKTEKKIYSEILNELNVRRPPLLLKSLNIKIPCMTGFFDSVVILPDKDFSESELAYIFRHELTHYINCDIWIKLFSNYICNLSWWNPVVYFFRNDITQVLEIKCDMSVCNKLSESQKIEYFSTILSLIKSVSRDKKMNYYTSSMAKGKITEKYTKQRFDMLLNGSTRQNNQASNFISVILILVLLCSYSFNIQPDYDPMYEDVSDDTFFLNSENSIIVLEDGKYNLYVNGKFRVIVEESELEFFKKQDISIKQ